MKNEMMVEELQTKNELTTLKVNGYYIHSKYNPVQEAERLAENFYKAHHVHVLFGYGCGYLVDAVLQKMQFEEPLIVIDPLFDEGKIVVQKRHEQLVIFNSTVIESFNFYLKQFIKDVRLKFQVFCLPNYDRLFPEMYREILSQVKDVQMSNQSNDTTLILNGERWQRNFTDNLFNFTKDYSLALLYQKYSCPVIIASGGPSLNKQLPLLKKIADKVIIIAAGSTIRSLIAENIYPQYVLSIDGAEINYTHFEGLTLDKIRLIYTLFNYPKIRNLFKNPGYVVDTAGWAAFTRYIRNELNVELPITGGGASVANHIFSVAQYISSGPIALIGQDLAFTNNTTHAANNKQTEKVDENYLKKVRAFQVEGYHGDLVWTTQSLNTMKVNFEESLGYNYPKVPFFNCTEGGVKIRGFKQSTFQEFCNKYVSNKKITLVEHDIGEKINYNVEEVIEKQVKLYDKLINIFTDGLKELKTNRSNVVFEERVLKKLDKIEEKSHEILKKLPIESIVSPLTLRIKRGYLPKENETKEEAYIRVYNQTKDLYTEMIEAIKNTKEYTKETLKKYRSGE